MARFRRAFYKLLPSWLTTGDGEKVLFSLGVVKDAFAEQVRQGLLARFPEHGPPSALPYLGRDRKIVRGINESADAYARRLVAWLDVHRVRGSMFALMDSLADYCNAAVKIRTVDRAGNWYLRDRDGSRSWALAQGNWDWDAVTASKWSRFWVIIYPTSAGEPWAAQPYAIGDAGLWGSAVGVDGYTIGSTATPEQVATVRQIIRDGQPDGTRCEWIVIAFDDSSFDPTAPEPDGTWAHWGKDDGAGNYVPARLSTARYWKGVDGSELTT